MKIEMMLERHRHLVPSQMFSFILSQLLISVDPAAKGLFLLRGGFGFRIGKNHLISFGIGRNIQQVVAESAVTIQIAVINNGITFAGLSRIIQTYGSSEVFGIFFPVRNGSDQAISDIERRPGQLGFRISV